MYCGKKVLYHMATGGGLIPALCMWSWHTMYTTHAPPPLASAIQLSTCCAVGFTVAVWFGGRWALVPAAGSHLAVLLLWIHGLVGTVQGGNYTTLPVLILPFNLGLGPVAAIAAFWWKSNQLRAEQRARLERDGPATGDEAE